MNELVIDKDFKTESTNVYIILMSMMQDSIDRINIVNSIFEKNIKGDQFIKNTVEISKLNANNMEYCKHHLEAIMDEIIKNNGDISPGKNGSSMPY